MGESGTVQGRAERDTGFEGWVETLAGELYSLGFAGSSVEEPEDFQEARDFLLSRDGLGGEEGFSGILPGLYLHGVYHGYAGRAGEDLLYSVWRTAWEEVDGEDCDLRVVVTCDPGEHEGEVIGLDLTSREGSAHGTLLFHEQPHMRDLVCASEDDLRELYRWVWRS